MHATPKEVTKASKLQSISTTTETSVSQSSPSHSSKGKAGEIHAACDVADNGRNFGQNDIVQGKQAAHKPCSAYHVIIMI